MPSLHNKVVGVADASVSADGRDSFTTYGLGSCIAVTLHDPVAVIGGMLHFLLPERRIESARGRTNPFIYADTGIPEILNQCLRLGAKKPRLVVRAAGGATFVNDNGFFDVGRRNHLSLCNALRGAGLFLHSEAIGGTVSRSLRLDIATGKVWVKEEDGPSVEMEAS